MTPSVSRVRVLPVLLLAVTLVAPTLAVAQEPSARVDYLTLAAGAVPVAIGGAGAGMRVSMTEALQAIDGNPGGFTLLGRATAESDVEFVYELPAPTVFDRFAVPSVLETPSPSQTFFREIAILGSDTGPEGPWVPLAEGRLETHAAAGQVTELVPHSGPAVRWIKLRLVDGIEMLRDSMFLEFSEIVGNGTQEAAATSDSFRGYWEARGVRIWLQQEGASVNGCYDGEAALSGTVTGNLLRARGADPASGVESLFVLAVDSGGNLRGVRSTNGAPFRLYEGPPSEGEPRLSCPAMPTPSLGCDSVIHAIRFDYDSAVIRPESADVLDELFHGLESTPGSIVIEGHTSSEGSPDYNLALSERRAQAVVDALVTRGIDAERIGALGVGESSPIASNDDEAGRSLNRRVEVRCTE